MYVTMDMSVFEFLDVVREEFLLWKIDEYKQEKRKLELKVNELTGQQIFKQAAEEEAAKLN